jgi:hypothetical protein
MKPIRIPTLSPEQFDSLEKLYRTTRKPRLRTRAQMVLLAAEQRMTAAQIAEIVRASEETVRRLISSATSLRGLRDYAMCRIRVLRARSRRSIRSDYSMPCVGVPAAWTCRSRCGRCVVWLTTWPSKPVSGWSTRLSGCT